MSHLLPEALPTLAEQKRRLIRQKLTRELGPAIMQYLGDPSIVEIMVNPDSTLWIDVLGQGMRDTGVRISPLQAENILCTIASIIGVTIDADRPWLQGELPLDGSRIQGTYPPITANACFAIRKRASLIYTLNDYIRMGILDPAHALALHTGIVERKNILIVGSTGSGKTTLANALLHDMSMIVGANERIVIIEDTVELQCATPNVVSLRTSDNVDMTHCLKITMRLRPDRIIVGEVRDHSAQALLKAWNTGHPGGICTVHANGAAAGLLRLEQLISEDRNMQPQPALIAEAVDLIAFITRTQTSRRVMELLRTNGTKDGTYLLESISPQDPTPPSF